jgi:hypothetical protein
LIIKNGSKVSNQIKEYQETTKSWLKGEQLKESVEEQLTQTAEEARDETLDYQKCQKKAGTVPIGQCPDEF